MIKTKNVLLYGAPSSGKSSLAALVFGLLKLENQNCELIREYAKDLVWAGQDMKKASPEIELDIFVNQTKRERLVKGKVEYMVSDSPLLLNAFYSHNEYAKDVALKSLSSEDYHFWLTKDEARHENAGRSHDQDEALAVAKQMKEFLTQDCGIKLITVEVPVEQRAAWIVEFLLKDAKIK
jgi:energy-coupling factor transporter ATP-binding protein EcfA2